MKPAPLLLTIIAAFAFAACAPLSRTPPGARPADFTLTFFVEQPAGRHELYHVGADRALRAARGADVTPDLYPPVTARLTPAQMDELWSLVPPEDAAAGPGGASSMVYHVRLTADGRVRERRVGPGSAEERLLGTLRGWAR